ncbi:MAG TPA: hypothetical protein VIW48_07555 [Nitrospiraceae bacterium]
MIVRAIAKNPTLSIEAKRRWAASVRNTLVFVLLVGLVVIWAHELQAFAVPLVASCRRPRNSFSVGAGRGYGWAGKSTRWARKKFFGSSIRRHDVTPN